MSIRLSLARRRSRCCSSTLHDTSRPSSDNTLDAIVDGARDRGYTGALDELVNLLVGGTQRVAGEGALVVALPEEVGVDNRCEEGVLEGDGTEQDADEDEDFGVGHDRHRAVIVGLDPNLELLSERWGSRRAASSGGRTRWHEHGHECCPRECESMEKREDGIGQQSNSDGFRGPPEDGESEVLNVLIEESSANEGNVGLDGTEAFLTNDGIAQQSTSEAEFIPP